jgi:hypothetical protein
MGRWLLGLQPLRVADEVQVPLLKAALSGVLARDDLAKAVRAAFTGRQAGRYADADGQHSCVRGDVDDRETG